MEKRASLSLQSYAKLQGERRNPAIAGISRRTGKFTNMEYGRSWNESNFWGAWLDLQLLSFLLLHHAFFAGQYLWRLPSLVAKSWDDQQARRRHFTTQHGYGYSGNGKSWKVSMFHRSITKEKSTNLHPLIKGFSVCCRFLMATSFGNEKATNACDVCIFPAPLMKIDESAPPIITNRMEIWWNMVIWCSTVMGTKSESGTKSWGRKWHWLLKRLVYIYSHQWRVCRGL